MGDKTGIAWTNASWNPTRGCRRISPGCEHCYAERTAIRMSNAGGAYEGLVQLGKYGPRWTGKGRFAADLLDQPLRWKRPRRIFVDSMSDLFFEAFTDREIAAVFGVMAAASWHTFQILTKRPKRMREWFAWASHIRGTDLNTGARAQMACDALLTCEIAAARLVKFPPRRVGTPHYAPSWPLPNVHLGVSVEDQDHADERIPDLLATPAAVRFISYEPALGAIDVRRWLPYGKVRPLCKCETQIEEPGPHVPECHWSDDTYEPGRPFLDWVIVGGESGARARPFDLEWARAIVRDCANAGVACFVKQMGSNAVDTIEMPRVFHSVVFTKKGSNPDEWPPELRVQQFPTERA